MPRRHPARPARPTVRPEPPRLLLLAGPKPTLGERATTRKKSTSNHAVASAHPVLLPPEPDRPASLNCPHRCPRRDYLYPGASASVCAPLPHRCRSNGAVPVVVRLQCRPIPKRCWRLTSAGFQLLLFTSPSTSLPSPSRLPRTPVPAGCTFQRLRKLFPTGQPRWSPLESMSSHDARSNPSRTAVPIAPAA
ncbi:hypothetical protein PMIN01_02502 [Paraphaeosphaeria minitans]|uniref:Uncharacterized protein n=1 Tax=Paraphaeosphaeria minitans TaxID=565426 RepID=A0A9P6KUZ1_9PLEO|nr:hypothetical protein PMIN01_02502 [Paraphaeosphaeria minitans]